MIIDCFTYYNERELLRFHINHVYDYVDKIIIIEGDRTYDGRPYQSTIKFDLYPYFINHDPKIEHHIVPLKPNPKDRWQNEALQRHLAGEIAKQYDGTLFFECVDEIINTDYYGVYEEPFCFSLDNYYYYFNGKDVGERPDHPMPIVIPTKFIKDLHTQWERRSSFPTILHAGWHFSYLGGVERIKQKLAAYSHIENDTQEIKDNLQKNIELGNDIFGRDNHRFEYVAIDDSFPAELVKNQDRYREFIHAS